MEVVDALAGEEEKEPDLVVAFLGISAITASLARSHVKGALSLIQNPGIVDDLVAKINVGSNRVSVQLIRSSTSKT